MTFEKGWQRMSRPITSPASKPLMTRDQLREFLNAEGFPLGESTFEKICMPSRNEGPEVEAYWGGRPLYSPERGLAWARSRLSKTRKRGA
jgi:hypothetical protein